MANREFYIEDPPRIGFDLPPPTEAYTDTAAVEFETPETPEERARRIGNRPLAKPIIYFATGQRSIAESPAV